jgi:two-component system sensor histidine kinase YesM
MKTVQGQYARVMTMTIACGMLLLGFFSLRVIRGVADNRGREYMVSSANLLRGDMEREYADLLLISQHMTPEGSVGADLNMVLSANSAYDQGKAKRDMDKDLSLITFSVRQSEIAVYCDENGSDVIVSTMSVKPSFNAAANLAELFASDQLAYHAIHQSQSYISNHPVVSLTRLGVFGDDRPLLAYAECRTGLPDSISAMTDNGGSGYILLQLDASGIVQYSSDPAFRIGQDVSTITKSNKEFGYLGDYLYAASATRFGFSCAILQHRGVFYSDVIRWLMAFIAASCAAAMLLIVSTLMLRRFIFKRMQVMIDAIDRIGAGSLETAADHTGLAEFDLLLERFFTMTARVQQLAADVAGKEAERANMELENLRYRINPHFLLNSLNAMHWLARINGQEDIGALVRHLSHILSYSLGRSGEHPTLRTELEILRHYVALEQYRHSFEAEFDIDDGDYLDQPSPRLLLQPLVENAVNHGIDEGGRLLIRFAGNGQGGAAITIQDDGCGLSDEMIEALNSPGGQVDDKRGIGLKYVTALMERHYGSGARISFAGAHGGGTVVSLWIDGMTGGGE